MKNAKKKKVKMAIDRFFDRLTEDTVEIRVKTQNQSKMTLCKDEFYR